MSSRAYQPVVNTSFVRGGSDGSYINTGITPDRTTRVIIWARNLNPHSSQYGWVVGSRVANLNASFGFVSMMGINSGKIRVCYGNSNTDNRDMWTLLSNFHKYELGPNGFYVDDVLISSVSGAPTNSYPLFIFGMNNAGTVLSQTPNPIDVFACKIYKGGILVRDFVATNSPSVGLYDKISDTLFTNEGSGSFTYGTFDPDTYIPLEYIIDSGSSYIDIGIRGTNTLNYICKYRPNCTASWPYLFGAQTSSSSKRYGVAFGNATTKGKEAIFLYADGSYTYSHSSTMNGNDYVVVKNDVSHNLYLNNISMASNNFTASSFTTDYDIVIGGNNSAGNKMANYNGRIYYLSFETLKNLVPAKVNNEAGLYDTYNDVFYPSDTETSFTAGPEL